jgi:hypothetical protein
VTSEKEGKDVDRLRKEVRGTVEDMIKMVEEKREMVIKEEFERYSEKGKRQEASISGICKEVRRI